MSFGLWFSVWFIHNVSAVILLYAKRPTNKQIHYWPLRVQTSRMPESVGLPLSYNNTSWRQPCFTLQKMILFFVMLPGKVQAHTVQGNDDAIVLPKSDCFSLGHAQGLASAWLHWCIFVDTATFYKRVVDWAYRLQHPQQERDGISCNVNLLGCLGLTKPSRLSAQKRTATDSSKHHQIGGGSLNNRRCKKVESNFTWTVIRFVFLGCAVTQMNSLFSSLFNRRGNFFASVFFFKKTA